MLLVLWRLPYDSLNISTDGAPIVGSSVDPNGVFVNYYSPGLSLSCGNIGSPNGMMQLDTPCWTGFHPQIEVISSGRATPPSKGKKPQDP